MKAKKVRKIIFILTIAIILCLVLISCNNKNTGDLKQAKTIDIKTVKDLQSLNNYLGEEYSLYTFNLTKSLNLEGVEWEPIGYSAKHSFMATFNGNGHTISNLFIEGFNTDTDEYIKRIPYEYVGLFGYIYDATIKDFELKDFVFSYIAEEKDNYVGGLTGFVYGETTLKDIKVSGKINVGTSYYVERKEVWSIACDQTQYLGGIVGHSAGMINLEDAIASVEINNMIASRGPKIDYHNDRIEYEKDKKGRDTDQPVMQILLDTYDTSTFPLQAFAGSIAGFVKGHRSSFKNIEGHSIVPSLHSRSAYLGGLFGASYNCDIKNAVYLNGDLQTRVYIKGVSGGIAGLIDQTYISNVLVEDTQIRLNVSKSEYQSYTSGGLVGYANDFSTIINSKVKDTKILSNLPNVKPNQEVINYPVIGGLVGTIRDSAISNCQAQEGGVYKTNGADIDNTYIFSAGLVADVYGNTILEECKSSFKAYTGAIARYTETVYVEENGKRILRYIKEDLPRVYVGVDAYIEDETLMVTFIDESNENIATYEYGEYEGDNDIENFSKMYYNEAIKKLVDAEGKTISIDGRKMADYVRLTGYYSFKDLTYKVGSVIAEGSSDEKLDDDWNKFII